MPTRPVGQNRGVIIDLPPARPADCLPILRTAFATVTAAFGITADNTPSNPAFWTPAEFEHAVSRAVVLLGAEEDGVLVGCAFLGPSPSRAGVWVLRHLAVHPAARHRGHGEALVAAAASRARAAGATTLRVGIVAENTRLADWYLRLGFARTEHDVRYPGLVFAVDHFEWPLDNVDK